MIPIGTAVPPRYPPIVTWVLIASNCAAFLFQQSLSPAELNKFIDEFALIPARYRSLFGYGDADQKAADLLPSSSGGGVASWAHVGGFIVGLVLIPFIQRRKQDYRVYYGDEGIFGFNTQGLR
jgi:membrane associated rhomboid family serine protease